MLNQYIDKWPFHTTVPHNRSDRNNLTENYCLLVALTPQINKCILYFEQTRGLISIKHNLASCVVLKIKQSKQNRACSHFCWRSSRLCSALWRLSRSFIIFFMWSLECRFWMYANQQPPIPMTIETTSMKSFRWLCLFTVRETLVYISADKVI